MFFVRVVYGRILVLFWQCYSVTDIRFVDNVKKSGKID